MKPAKEPSLLLTVIGTICFVVAVKLIELDRKWRNR